MPYRNASVICDEKKCYLQPRGMPAGFEIEKYGLCKSQLASSSGYMFYVKSWLKYVLWEIILLKYGHMFY